MLKAGIIYSVDLKNRIFSLNLGRRLAFYYISNNLMKKFKKYLYKGNYVSFVIDDSTLSKRGNVMAYTVSYFKEISVPGRYGKDIFYSKKDIKDEMKTFINSLSNLLFVDIEMSMPSYSERGKFLSELIQIGFFILDKSGEILEKNNIYVKPTINKFLTDRTEDFLDINYSFLEKNGVSYIDFYNSFKIVLEKYNPTIIVFGKNDRKFLESSYHVNSLPSLTEKSRFVNLNQILKNYYDLANDPGLFKMYEKMYNKSPKPQKHDALEDAYYTYLVYEKFKGEVNK